MMTIGEKIFTLRKRDGLSQEELAIKLGVSRQAVYKWESGNSLPEIDKIKLIAKLFNTSFDYLMNDEIETYETAQQEPTKRKCYYSGMPFTRSASEMDNGITPLDKKNKKYSPGTLKDTRAAAMNTLSALGITEICFPDRHSATVFFYNDQDHTFGIYFGGKIHFICPIENLSRIEPRITQGGAEVMILYSDENDTFKNLKILFSFSPKIDMIHVSWEEGSEAANIGIAESVKRYMTSIVVAANEFIMKLDAYRVRAIKMIEGGKSLGEPSDEILALMNKADQSYNDALDNASKKSLSAHRIKVKATAIKLGIVGVGILLVILSFVFQTFPLAAIGAALAITVGLVSYFKRKPVTSIVLGVIPCSLLVAGIVNTSAMLTIALLCSMGAIIVAFIIWFLFP